MCNCLFPVTITLRDHANKQILVGCGKCYYCLQERRKSWYIRNLEELRSSKNEMSVFVTLTYRDSDLPRYESGLPHFSKSHVQKFIDRLRKKLIRGYDCELRYFLVSEYGDQTERPHYHALMYLTKTIGIMDFQKLLDDSWIYQDLTTDWHYMNEAMISYCCNYVLSYIYSSKNNLERPFMLSSRRPAIGSSFLQNDLKVNDSFRGDFIGYQDFQFRYKLPRYYKDKILSDDDKFDILETYLEYLQEEKRKDALIRLKKGDERYYMDRINDFWNRVRTGEIKLSKSKHKL